MNEEDLIRRLLDAARGAGAQLAADHIVRGPGDDAAVLLPPADHELVWTCDDQVEGVHFRAAWCDRERAGRKAVGAALSDLAAMGAKPLGALLSLGVRENITPTEIDALGRGVGAKLAQSECPLVGGNVTRNPDRLTIAVTALGSAPRGRSLCRSMGKPGDLLYVSGSLGWARLGLLWLEGGGDSADPRWSEAVERLLDPCPRLDLGAALLARGERIACLDISDGLSRDLPRLLSASGLAAVVDADALPAPDPELADVVGERAELLAWLGGEDYDLLVAGAPGLEQLLPLRVIGRLEAGHPGQVTLEGSLEVEQPEGFDHLS